MICPKCNREIPEGMKFCPSCGNPVPQKRHCSNCGNELIEGTRFCSKCGSPIGQFQSNNYNATNQSGIDSIVQSSQIVSNKKNNHIINTIIFAIVVIVICITGFEFYSSSHKKSSYSESSTESVSTPSNNSNYEEEQKRIEEETRHYVNCYNMSIRNFRLQLDMNQVVRAKIALQDARRHLEEFRKFAERENLSGLIDMYNEEDIKIRQLEQEMSQY